MGRSSGGGGRSGGGGATATAGAAGGVGNLSNSELSSALNAEYDKEIAQRDAYPYDGASLSRMVGLN